MTISYHAGATTVQTGVAHTVQPALTVPATVSAGDLMLASISVFTYTNTGDYTLTATSGHAWVSLGGGLQTSGPSSGLNVYSRLWARTATAGDASDTLTFAFTGTPGATDQFWWAIALDSWTGASAVDVIAVPLTQAGGASTTITTPVVSTASIGDWRLEILASGVSAAGTITSPPSGDTIRGNPGTAGINVTTADSGASVGAAGTSIGGGFFTSSGSAIAWSVAWTLGLQDATSPSLFVPAPTRNSVLEHPQWQAILTGAAYRARVAPAAATLQPFTWRLMDGAGGRPGNGPGTATGAGNNVNGTGFYVTQGGMWLQGYWWWVAAAGGQSTSPQKFALWSCFNGGSFGQVVQGSAVTSGALSAGWNYIPLAQPVQLAIGGQYMAATAITGTAPVTGGQTNSGGPYSAGIANGPLHAFSDANGSNPAPYSFGSGATATGTDPSATLPTGDANAGNNYWLDVQVTNAAPAGYSGSYRLWPNMADADSNTAIDAAVNYVLATEFALSQPCVLNAIWYYRPNGTVQFATSVDVWRVSDQARVATQPSPSWTVAGGGAAPVSGQQWVRAAINATLPAGGYKVSVYNGAGTPDNWSAKRLGYWQALATASGGSGTPDGTYLHSPPGANGITNGPLYAPTTPLASAAVDYSTSAIEPGQSTFATGPPNQYPGIYVGQSSAGIYTGPALFQNYWVDAEVTPVAPGIAAPAPQLVVTRTEIIGGGRGGGLNRVVRI